MVKKLKPFPLRNLTQGYFRAIFLGSSGTGKTHYLLEWYKKKLSSDYKKVIVITTKINRSFYEHNMPNAAVFTPDGTDKELIAAVDKLIDDFETSLYEHGVAGKNDDGSYRFKYNTLIVFDDIISEKMVHKSKVNMAFCRFRHLQTSIIFLIQNGTRVITSTMKCNSNYFVLFRMNDQVSKRVQLNQMRNVISSKPENALISDKIVKKAATELYRDNILEVPYGRIIVDHNNTMIYR